MTTASLTWREGQDRTTGSVAATIALDEAAWAAAGASFTTVPDGVGGDARLAVGVVAPDGQPTEFGVLAYEDDDVSHLIVGGPYEDRPNLTAQIVDDLLAAGVVPDEEFVLEIIGLAKPASVDDKLDYVVDIVEATVSEAHRELQMQVHAMQAAFEALVSQRPTPDVDIVAALALDRSGLNLLPIHGGGLRNLVILRGIAHAHGHDEHVSIRASAAVFPMIVRLQDSSEQPGLSAHLMSVNANTGEAVVTFEAEDSRVPLIIGGLGQSMLDGLEEITLPSLAPAAPYADRLSMQQTFDLVQQPQDSKSPPRRRIRFRITR